MKKQLFLFAAALVLIWSCTKNASKTQSKSQFAEAEKTYSQYCATCHGEQVDAFVDRRWKHGNTKAEIIASITNGYLDNGMPAWKGTVSDANIEAVADLIVNKLSTVSQYDFKDVAKTDTYTSKGLTVKLESVLDDIDSPWGLAALPDGSLLVTDRAGDLWKVNPDKSKAQITGVPEVLAVGQGGMFDIKLHPDYKNNGWIYLTYTKFKEENGKKLSTTAMLRGRLEGNTLVNKEEIFVAVPFFETRLHYGARMTWGQDGFLYVSVGERGLHFENAQNLETSCGKIHRIYDDGRIPADNPYYNTPNAIKSIWSFGHRNPQGLVTNPINGEIWEHEHGPRGGDEVNIIKKGANYGWPVISYGINYDGKPITNISAKEGMEQPEIYWLPSIAPCGMTFVTSDKYPAWKGDLLAGSLRFNYLNRCDIENNKIVDQEKVLINIGRLRNVVQAEDGYIYVGIENPGTVYRLLPQ